MRRTFAPTLLMFACAAALAGCTWTRPGSGGVGANAGGRPDLPHGADETIPQLKAFTDELLRKVETAPDTKAGVSEAQALLDARKGELAGRIAASKRAAAPDAGAKGRWLEAEVDNTDRVHRLQLKYSDAAARDPDLKARLERLIADYDALYRER
jgi:hypothetical protein